MPHHPLSLGYDVCIGIFKDFSLPEIVCFERVNRRWKEFVREWMESSSTRLQLLTPWSSIASRAECNALSYVEIKRIIAMRHRLQNGHAASYTRLTHVSASPIHIQITAAGDSMAWKHVRSEKYPECKRERVDDRRRGQPDAFIYSKLPHQGDRPDGHEHEPLVQPTILLSLVEEIRGSVERFRTNAQGVLMINVKCWRQEWGKSRVIVYSPAENQLLWEYPNEYSNDYNYVVPLEIGREHIYCAVPSVFNRHDLVAYNFRTGEPVYQTTSLFLYNLPGTVHHPICLCKSPGKHGYHWQISGWSKLVAIGNSEEFLVQTSSRCPLGTEPLGIYENLSRRDEFLEPIVHNFDIVRASNGETR
ncbi:hypothetical protein BJX63DRAFT_320836 [Aspergillus granulosus]|uniref:F-box domain-containing protein n=1 Tax=Aspergillus granulosus TaxID=176169 RepID=A0ABR4H4E9_9EURO